jgi:hypothetical protein
MQKKKIKKYASFVRRKIKISSGFENRNKLDIKAKYLENIIR